MGLLFWQCSALSLLTEVYNAHLCSVLDKLEIQQIGRIIITDDSSCTEHKNSSKSANLDQKML